MCHYRGSYVSEDRAKAEADRQRELEAKRTQAVEKLKQEADTAAQKAASAPEKSLFRRSSLAYIPVITAYTMPRLGGAFHTRCATLPTPSRATT